MDEDYCVLLFRDTELVAAAFFEEYEAWYSVKYGVMGSTLGDANNKMTPEEFEAWLVPYLKNMSEFNGYELAFSTNDERQANLYMGELGVAVARWDIEHSLTVDRVDEQARLHYNEAVSMIGGEQIDA